MNNLLLEGKAKRIFPAPDPEMLILEFKDSLTAFNAKKKAELPGKGKLNARISSLLFQFLERQGLKTHFVEQTGENTLLVTRLNMIKIEVIVRNRATGSICQRLGLEDGAQLAKSIVQFHLKDDALNDPILTEGEILGLNLCRPDILGQITNIAHYVNARLGHLYQQIGIELIDFKLEFGLNEEAELVLGDELCPDNMRLWELGTQKRLDKDRFRLDLGEILEHYTLVADKLERVLDEGDHLALPAFPVIVNLQIEPQAGLLDPVGRTLAEAAQTLGFKSVVSIRAGKNLILEVSDYQLNLIPELCDRILVSPAAETYTYTIEPCAS